MKRKWVSALSVLLIGACAQGEPFARSADRIERMTLPQSLPMPVDSDVKAVAQNAFARGDYATAVTYYRRQTEITPQAAEAWLGLAASADRAGHFEISAPAYAKVRTLAGPVFEYHNNLGFSYLLQGRYREAEAELQQALALRPNDATALNNISLLHKLRG